MTLREYISQVGEDHAAKLWSVKRRTVASWRYGQRKPRPKMARIIVAKSPVTMEGIYGA